MTIVKNNEMGILMRICGIRFVETMTNPTNKVSKTTIELIGGNYMNSGNNFSDTTFI